MKFFLFLSAVLFLACQTRTPLAKEPSGQSNSPLSEKLAASTALIIADSMPTKIVKSETEWRKILGNGLAYNVLREKGTERAFTGKYWDNHEEGIYDCAACALPLFSSKTKFESGTGWPSFYEPIKKAHVIEHSDRSYGMVRTEVVCARCDGHLGHVFEDGPKPTGLRYCMNSVSLNFRKP
jgi:peptide-methionine (R)-S-oxide reductase